MRLSPKTLYVLDMLHYCSLNGRLEDFFKWDILDNIYKI